MQIPPSVTLQHCIKHYLFINTGTDSNFRLFADGNPAIVFSNGLLINKQLKLSGSFVYGQVNEFRDLYSNQAMNLMVVVLQPAGLQQLLELPATELQQLILPLNEVLGNTEELDERIFSATSYRNKIAVFEHFITERLAPSYNQEMNHIIGYINQLQGQLSIRQLCNFTGWQERKLERHFNSDIGISPKKFCDIIRLQFFIKQIKNNPTLTSASYEAGYSDQPHLIKTFKKYTGLTPTQYLSSLPLAVNFLALK